VHVHTRFKVGTRILPTGYKGTETKNQKTVKYRGFRARRSHRSRHSSEHRTTHGLFTSTVQLLYSRVDVSYVHMRTPTWAWSCSWASMAERARSRISLPDQRCWHIGTERDSEDTPAKGDGAVAASTHVVRARSGMQAKRIMRRAARCDGSRWPRGGVGVRGGYLQ
jgi:hypothetical protein